MSRGPDAIRKLLVSTEARPRLSSLVEAMEAGRPAEDLAFDPVEILAAFALSGLGETEAGGPPLIREEKPPSKLIKAASEANLSRIMPRAPRPKRLALSAGLLQILDAWEASHEAAQEADDRGEKPHSAYWHAIAHRREPDPGNAAYWFRRVGRHPVFGPLAERVHVLTAGHDRSVEARLLPGGAWAPDAFVGFCGESVRRPGSDAERLARAIQREEMLSLLDETAIACLV